MKKKKKLPVVVGIILIILVVAFTAIVVSSMGGGSGGTSTPDPAAKTTPATASAAPAEPPAPEVSALASNDYITITFEKLYEEPSIQGVAYLQLAMTNTWDKEIWVYLDKGSVNDEQLTSFLSGLPTYIMPGKTSRNPFIISYSQLSIESISEIQTVGFDVVVADRESLNEISRISGVQIQP